MSSDRLEALQAEIRELRFRLGEAESALEAIRRGDVESLVIEGPDGPRIFSLEGASHSYRVLIEAMNDGAATLSADATILYCNARFAEMLGSPLERVMGSSLYEWVPPGLQAAMTALVDEAREGESRGELELRRADGSDVPTTVSFKAFHDDGRPLVCLVAVDISERQRNEQVLAEGRLARSVLDQAAEMIVVCDENGRVTRASRTAGQLARRGPLRVDFDAAFPLVLPPPLPLGSLVHSALAGLVTRAESAMLTRPDGTQATLLVSASPLMENGEHVIGCVVTMVDVTEHRRAEDALARSERQLQKNAAELETVFATQTDSVIVYGSDGVASKANAAARAMLGFDPTGKHFQENLQTAGSLGEPRSSATARALSGETVSGAPFDFVDPSGRRRSVWTSSAPMRDATGQVTGAVTVSHDITELKQAEEVLREADRQKNHFLAMLSHELRNPLTPIRNSLFILDHVPAGGEQANRAKTIIERQVSHLTRLVDDLLDLTRIITGKLRIQRVRFDLAQMLVRAAEDHRAGFVEDGIELELRLCPGPLWMQGDEARIAQAISNLLANAVKFTERSGRVALITEQERATRMLVIRVRDTGIGVHPDLLLRLWEPFVQADETLDRSKGGLGLGLALVKNVVELHGGNVTAVSEGLGMGTEFIVRLPLEVQETFAPGDGNHASDRPRPRRVLVIEDNLDAADSLRDVLALGGHSVEVAYTGLDGIRKGRELKPDVVLCDIGLPDISGYDVAKALRADEALRSTCLVALTGYALPEDKQRAREAGFARHLPKPPSPETLEELLASLSRPKAQLLPIEGNGPTAAPAASLDGGQS